jgi:hypothetical protein
MQKVRRASESQQLSSALLILSSVRAEKNGFSKGK